MRACLVARSCGVPHANSTCNRGKKWKKANSGSEREREQEGDQLNEGKSSKPKKTATHTHFKFTISSSSEKGREREGCTDRSRPAMLKVVHFSSEFGAGGLCAYGFGSDSTVSHLLPPHSVLFGVLALLTYALGSFCFAAPPSYCFTYLGRILFGKLSEEKSTLVSKVLLGGFELCVNSPGGSGETVQNRGED